MVTSRGARRVSGITAALLAGVALAALAVPEPALARPAATATPAPAPTATGQLRIVEDFTGYPAARLMGDGAVFGPWRVVFDGMNHGPSIRLRPGLLRLAPQSARGDGATNAALVVSRRGFTGPSLALTATWTTRATTRIGVANPWEAGWLVWDYVDNDHFTYLVLKPNGWEVGRRDPSQRGGQRFVADGDLPTTPIGMTRTATVTRTDGTTSIKVDDQHLVTFTLPPNERRGAIGMYSEDAIVDWTSITAGAVPGT